MKVVFFAPGAMREEDVLITHSPNYWQKLIHQQLTEKEIRKIGFPMSSLLVERGRHIAMGTYMLFTRDGSWSILKCSGRYTPFL